MLNKTVFVTDAIDSFFRKNSNLTLRKLYENIDTIDIPSLRIAFLNYDLEVFSGINDILTVITSIAARPFVNNKREEVIVKSGTASNLSTEAFQKTLGDSKLWKRHNGEMIPEEVYYYQYYDELKTYENIFVITVTEFISSYLDRSRSFYSTLVRSIDLGDGTVNFDNSQIENILALIDKSIHRIARIQKTYFYRTVSKSPNRIKEVTPTNILVQNHYYNRVYKFYKDMIMKSDDTEVNSLLLSYYFLLFIRELHKRGLKLLSDDVNIFDPEAQRRLDIDFADDELTINIRSWFEKNAMELTVTDLKADYVNRHLIVGDVNDGFTDSYIPKNGDYAEVTYISPRNLAHLENSSIVIESPKSTGKYGLMKIVFDSMHSVGYGKEAIYSNICPCCTSRHIDNDGSVYRCHDCGTAYKITPSEGEGVSRITFGYLRRK